MGNPIGRPFQTYGGTGMPTPAPDKPLGMDAPPPQRPGSGNPMVDYMRSQWANNPNAMRLIDVKSEKMGGARQPSSLEKYGLPSLKDVPNANSVGADFYKPMAEDARSRLVQTMIDRAKGGWTGVGVKAPGVKVY